MGHLENGSWILQGQEARVSGGKFVRNVSPYRNWITKDGSAGPSGEAGFKAEKDRYHLYVSNACPWAHRTLIFRALKGLEDIIPISIVHWYKADNGWEFAPGDGVIPDPINKADYVYQIYTAAAPNFSGRATVPILWDKHQNTIVNNESSEIIRMFNSEFDELGGILGDYYPAHMRTEIDAINERVYRDVNNGVYKSGFATSQDAYEAAVISLFETLDWLEDILGKQRYLVGDTLTEADWRLFTTLIRFDPVYVGHFKCNIRRISDYPNLSNYVRDLYQHPKIADTVNMKHIKDHYYASHDFINPTRVIPVGPDIDFSAPHNRASK